MSQAALRSLFRATPDATRLTLAYDSNAITFCLDATLGIPSGATGTLVSEAFDRRLKTQSHSDLDRRVYWLDAFDWRYDRRLRLAQARREGVMN